jgi:4-hydroxy-tetrahydrodipicolinate reductase
MIYKVGLLGASGKMGLEIAALLSPSYEVSSDSLELTEAVVNKSKLVSIEGAPVTKLNSPPRESVHVWIDFSQPEATLELLTQVKAPIVIGTTGFTESQDKEIAAYAEKYPVVKASNFSIGMNWLFYQMKRKDFVPETTKEIVIQEEHHRNKKDAPSGTAKSLVSILKQNKFNPSQVHSVRAGEVKGIHQLRFFLENEEIEITHKVSDRCVFAKGALHAAMLLLKLKQPGLYSFEDLLFKGN